MHRSSLRFPIRGACLRRLFSSDVIRANTELSRAHLTPELNLHLITPRCAIFHARPGQDASSVPFEDPYWGFYWPGGQALTRFVLDNGGLVAERGVVDFGCGCGSAAIAATMRGASAVLAADIDANAISVTKMNAELNGVDPARIDFTTDNLIDSVMDPRWEVFLVGDMFYSDDLAKQLDAWFQELSRSGPRVILIGDPGRWAFSNSPIRAKVKAETSYSLPDAAQMENAIFAATVFSYVYERQ